MSTLLTGLRLICPGTIACERPLIIFQVSSITRDGKLEAFKIHYTEVDMSRIVVTVVGKQAGETNFAGFVTCDMRRALRLFSPHPFTSVYSKELVTILRLKVR
jgi:hypothetical protein